MKNHNQRSAPSRLCNNLAAPALPRWRFSALAAALVACAGLYSPDSSALTLGTITVQSALGEPLRAEIDLPQITPAEAESLRAATASADVFRMQGMDYSSTVSQMRVQLQRRPDGRMVLGLSGSNPVNEPFVDLVIDARWSAGQVTRSYTMLFDPPAPRRQQAATAAVVPSLASPAASAIAPPARRRAAPVTAADSTANGNSENNNSSSNAGPPASQRRATVPQRVPARQASADDTVTVRPGDTAGRIANARRQQGVSLDQMLVAMSRANPSAFVQGNVNRLKAGSVLQIPSQDEALATPANQARQLIAVQSRDFNAFRRRLADAAPDAEQAGAQRSASGSVQTRIEDSGAAATAQDKLTLSKGAMQGKKTTEEMLAQRKQGNQAAARAQELARNIEELNRLNAASGAPAAASSPAPAVDSTAAASGLAIPNPGLALPAEQPAAPTLSADGAQTGAPENTTAAEPSPGAEPGATADAPAATSDVASAPDPATTPEPPPAIEPGGFVQDLLEQPALPLAAGALLLLLVYGGYRAVQRSRSSPVAIDSGFVDSRVHPDSFFGASGGQRVDTAAADSAMGGPSLSYSPSQLDAEGEVDAVAEADVYLAYGRDLQAEEILREAARHQPHRAAIPAKLGEIYAKRLDSRALEVVARDVHTLTQGRGPEWERMVALGQQLDPDNALYQSGSNASAAAGLAGAVAAMGTMPAGTPAIAAGIPLDLDLDLDFELPDDALSEAPSAQGTAAAMAGDEDWDALEDLVAFNSAIAAPAEPATASGQSGVVAPGALDALSFPGAQQPATAPSAPDLQRDDFHPDSSISPATQTDEDLHPSLEMNLDWQEEMSPVQPAANQVTQSDNASAMASADDALDAFALNFDLPDLDDAAVFGSADNPSSATLPQTTAGKDSFVPSDSHLLDFDFESLSLDLDTPQSATEDGTSDALEPGTSLSDSASEEDPLATKLALAQEFHAIGDSEGARTLTEEVIAESSGALKLRAQNLLTELD